jgi:hypothetical protein
MNMWQETARGAPAGAEDTPEPPPSRERHRSQAAAPPCGGLHYSGSETRAVLQSEQMTDTPLPELVLYTRHDCALCDEARDVLHALLDERRRVSRPVPTFVELDIDCDPALQNQLSASIPVVELGDRRLELVTSAARLRRLLTDVLDVEPARA